MSGDNSNIGLFAVSQSWFNYLHVSASYTENPTGIINLVEFNTAKRRL